MPPRTLDDDAAAWAHYNDETLREVSPEHARTPRRPSLSAQVPIRFSPGMVAAVGRIAESDGMSVSSWIRHLVEKELSRRDASSGPTGRAAAQAAIETARRALGELENALTPLARVSAAKESVEHPATPAPRTRPGRGR
jgi:hypothetical protein